MLLSQNLAKAEEVGLNFMKKANTNSIVDLRKKSAEELQILSNNREVGRFGVTLDGYTLPVNLMEHFRKGLHNQTPVLTGWVIGDGSVLGESKMNLEDYKKEAQSKYGDKAGMFLTVFPATTDDEAKAAKQKLSLLGFAGLPAHLLAGFNTKTSYQ
jgi:para-nitrobenzyl esterase